MDTGNTIAQITTDLGQVAQLVITAEFRMLMRNADNHALTQRSVIGNNVIPVAGEIMRVTGSIVDKTLYPVAFSMLQNQTALDPTTGKPFLDGQLPGASPNDFDRLASPGMPPLTVFKNAVPNITGTVQQIDTWHVAVGDTVSVGALSQTGVDANGASGTNAWHATIDFDASQGGLPIPAPNTPNEVRTNCIAINKLLVAY